MRFGVTLPNVGYGGDPATLIQLAVDAEEAGWDGAFLWDTPYAVAPDEPAPPFADAWVLLSAIAVRTDRIRLGTMLTPLAWRRPWLIARQAATLDRLSGGRFTLAVGLGAPPDEGPWFGGDEFDRRTRAAMLDESLAILEGLWSGQPFAFEGEHFNLREVTFIPRPRPAAPSPNLGRRRLAPRPRHVAPPQVDAPRHPLRRSPPQRLRRRGRVRLRRLPPTRRWTTSAPCAPGSSVSAPAPSPTTSSSNAVLRTSTQPRRAPQAERWEAAGATWWLEDIWQEMWASPDDPEPLRRRILRGPPR